MFPYINWVNVPEKPGQWLAKYQQPFNFSILEFRISIYLRMNSKYNKNLNFRYIRFSHTTYNRAKRKPNHLSTQGLSLNT